MDEALTNIAARGPSSSGGVARGMPPEAPGLMPPQPLARFDGASRRAPRRPGGARSARWRRLLVLGTAAALAGFAIDEMRLALAVGQPRIRQWGVRLVT